MWRGRLIFAARFREFCSPTGRLQRRGAAGPVFAAEWKRLESLDRLRRFSFVNRLSLLIGLFGWLSIVAGVASSSQAAEVEVRLTDGRLVRGAVNVEQTNPQQLALEQHSAGIKLRRTLSWTNVVDVRIVSETKIADRTLVAPTSAVSVSERSPTESFPLSQLLVQATPISTTGKIDWDSLRLTLRGDDVHGREVPLFGTLKVHLWGQRRVSPESQFVTHPFVTEANQGSRFLAAPSNSSAYQHPYVNSPNPFVELASWTQVLRDDQDRVMRLPLPSPLLEHDSQVGTIGEVTVQLLMPGVGIFEASDPDVILSNSSRLRRERLDRDGSRFFPNEITADSPQTTRSRNRFTWPGGVSGPERGILPIQP